MNFFSQFFSILIHLFFRCAALSHSFGADEFLDNAAQIYKLGQWTQIYAVHDFITKAS